MTMMLTEPTTTKFPYSVTVAADKKYRERWNAINEWHGV